MKLHKIFFIFVVGFTQNTHASTKKNLVRGLTASGVATLAYWLSCDSDLPKYSVLDKINLVDFQPIEEMSARRGIRCYAYAFPQLIPAMAGKLVFEAGAGDGYFIKEYLDWVNPDCQYVAFEPNHRNPDLLEELEREYPQVNFIPERLENYGRYMNGWFDVYIDYLGAISYTPDLGPALSVMVDLLKVGGKGFVMTSSLYQRFPKHQAVINEEELSLRDKMELMLLDLGEILRENMSLPLGFRIYRKYTLLYPVVRSADGTPTVIFSPLSIRSFLEKCVKGIRIAPAQRKINKGKMADMDAIVFEKISPNTTVPSLKQVHYREGILPEREYHFAIEDCPEAENL